MFLYRFLPLFLLCILPVLFSTGCDSTDPDNREPEINGTMQVEGGRGSEVEIVLNLSTESGISALSVSMNGENPEALTVEAGALEQTYIYPFVIPPESTVGTTYALQFKLIDQDDVESYIDVVVTTGKLIEPPATYAFSRDGATSVSYPGQEDRARSTRGN